jgi:predicted GIY-YIG superfamily endonuclease
MKNQGTDYLLHFSEAYKPARHYVGFTQDLTARLESHMKGTGAGVDRGHHSGRHRLQVREDLARQTRR